MLRLYLYARVRFPCAQLHTRPRVQRAPGLPCALSLIRGRQIDSKARTQCVARSSPHLQLSSSALCAIAHWGGRSSIPEAVVIEPITRGVLDPAPARGMTRSGDFGRHCERSVLDALSARSSTASCATRRLCSTIFSCIASAEQRRGQSVITICLFGTQIAARDSAHYFCGSARDCSGDDLFSTHEEPTDRLDSRSRKDKVRDGEEIAWVNFLAR